MRSAGGRVCLGRRTTGGGYVDAGNYVAQVCLGRGACHGSKPGRAEGAQAGGELCHGFPRRRIGEHRRDHRVGELRWWEVGQPPAKSQPLLDLFRRQGPGPSRVCAGEHQRPRDGRMPPQQLEEQRPTERQSNQMGACQSEDAHESCKAVSLVRQPKPLRRLQRVAGARRVPCHDSERVRQVFDLPGPGRPAIADEAAHKHKRRPAAGSLLGDPQPVNLYLIHRSSALPGFHHYIEARLPHQRRARS